jgi:8-oxo-dGTP pyrophosphatase MutT (NUDIX family)
MKELPFLAREVDVVVGILTDGDKFLVERRGHNEILDPDVVCLPGGHVDKGESYEKALKREMFEELGITVKSMKFIWKNFRIASNGERQHSYCFVITAYEGKPAAKSAKEIFWTNNMGDLSLEVDKQTIRKLKEIH